MTYNENGVTMKFEDIHNDIIDHLDRSIVQSIEISKKINGYSEQDYFVSMDIIYYGSSNKLKVFYKDSVFRVVCGCGSMKVNFMPFIVQNNEEGKIIAELINKNGFDECVKQISKCQCYLDNRKHGDPYYFTATR